MKSINPLSEINTSRILRLVWQKKGISRVEIANTLNLDKSTVTKIVSSLNDIGIINEIAQGETGPQGGRKPIYLEIASNFACVGGIEINPERFVCCLLDLQGNILFQHQEMITPENFAELQVEGIFEKAYNLIFSESKKLNIKMICLGVGFPAPVNSDKGYILSSVPLMIDSQYQFVSEIKKYTNLPVIIENDARCCCYGELTCQSSDFVKNSVFVLLEHRLLQPKSKSRKNLSVGLGIIMDGKIVKGPECSAGEFRSILWEQGNNGQFLSTDEELNSDSLFLELAQHIAFLVNTLNLQSVIIGGIDKSYIKRISKLIEERINLQWPYTKKENVLIQASSFDYLAVAYGAAAMYINQLFSLPSLSNPMEKKITIANYISEI